MTTAPTLPYTAAHGCSPVAGTGCSLAPFKLYLLVTSSEAPGPPSSFSPAPGPLPASPGSVLVLSCHHCRLQSCIPSSACACPPPHRRHDGGACRVCCRMTGAGGCSCHRPVTTARAEQTRVDPNVISVPTSALQVRSPHLSTVDARWNVPFDSTIVRGIHPEKKLPASRERNRQGMEDLFGMDAKKKPNRNCLNEIQFSPPSPLSFFYFCTYPLTLYLLKNFKLPRECDKQY